MLYWANTYYSVWSGQVSPGHRWDTWFPSGTVVHHTGTPSVVPYGFPLLMCLEKETEIKIPDLISFRKQQKRSVVLTWISATTQVEQIGF